MSRSVAEAALCACRAALRLCRGEYEELLRETALFAVDGGDGPTTPADAPTSGRSPHETGDTVRATVRAFIVGGITTTPAGGSGSGGSGGTADPATVSPEKVAATGHGRGNEALPVAVADGGSVADPAATWRAAEVVWVGAASLNLFLQENYSGPELEPERRDGVGAWLAEKMGLCCSGASAAQDAANFALACDGELPYPKTGLPGSLVMARTILSALSSVSTPAATTGEAAAMVSASGGRASPWGSPGNTDAIDVP